MVATSRVHGRGIARSGMVRENPEAIGTYIGSALGGINAALDGPPATERGRRNAERGIWVVGWQSA